MQICLRIRQLRQLAFLVGNNSQIDSLTFYAKIDLKSDYRVCLICITLDDKEKISLLDISNYRGRCRCAETLLKACRKSFMGISCRVINVIGTDYFLEKLPEKKELFIGKPWSYKS